MCNLRSGRVVAVWLHWEHLKLRSSTLLWVSRWAFKLHFTENPLPQYWQLKGFSLVWTRSCCWIWSKIKSRFSMLFYLGGKAESFRTKFATELFHHSSFCWIVATGQMCSQIANSFEPEKVKPSWQKSVRILHLKAHRWHWKRRSSVWVDMWADRRALLLKTFGQNSHLST